MAKAHGDTFVKLSPSELRTRLSDPVAWTRHQWGDDVQDIERLDDRSARVVLDLERGTHESVISRAWEDANTIEYVIPPKGRISLTRRVKYELREHEHGTTVTVTESIEPTTAFKLLTFGVFIPLAAFAARGNLRFDLERLAALSRD